MNGSLLPRERTEIAPGAVHVPDWLPLERQRELVDACREWARGPAPMRHTRLPNGSVMSVRTVCLGWHWVPYRYTRFAEDTGGAPVAPFPDWLAELGRRALADAYDDEAAGAAYAPDAALVNFYDGEARTRTRTSAATRRSSRSASATRASSASATRSRAAARTRTSSCAPATCSSSADRRASPTTACRSCCRARPTTPAGWRAGGSI
jgi:2OG-Fe(II) oxygenase superfamily